MTHLNIQRFHAPTAREALALARAAFGDDALILSNRQLANGVEVTAASEAALGQLEGEGAVVPPAAPPVTHSVVPSATVAPAPAPAAATPTPGQAALASSRAMVQADTEQLAMSTLSFQDYVRERMLRRQQQQEQPGGQRAAPPAAARTEVPMTRWVPVAPHPAPAPAQPAEGPAPSLPQVLTQSGTDKTSPAPADASAGVMAQLQAMHQLMEERFNTLAWLSQARQDPIHSNLMLKLVRAGYSPLLVRELLQDLPGGSDAGEVVRVLMQRLTDRVQVDPQPLPEQGGMYALIGATGVGKTTTAAKLAGQCIRVHGAASVGLITLDTQRAGAHEQLRAFARSLGAVAHLAHDGAALAELLGLLGNKKLVIVDTPGIAPRDVRRRELLDLLNLPRLTRVLVLNAGAHGDTLEEVATSYKLGGTRQAIVTKLDEAAKLGPVLDTVMRHQLVLRGVTHGQRVPDDWKLADPVALVRESMRSAQRSPFDPRSADFDFVFSPAACPA